MPYLITLVPGDGREVPPVVAETDTEAANYILDIASDYGCVTKRFTFTPATGVDDILTSIRASASAGEASRWGLGKAAATVTVRKVERASGFTAYVPPAPTSRFTEGPTYTVAYFTAGNRAGSQKVGLSMYEAAVMIRRLGAPGGPYYSATAIVSCAPATVTLPGGTRVSVFPSYPDESR